MIFIFLIFYLKSDTNFFYPDVLDDDDKFIYTLNEKQAFEYQTSVPRNSRATCAKVVRNRRETGTGLSVLDSNLLQILPKSDPNRRSSGPPGPKLARLRSGALTCGTPGP